MRCSSKQPQALKAHALVSNHTRRAIETASLFLVALVIALACSLVLASPAQAFAEKTSDTKVVKVGYLIIPNFQEGGEGEYKNGEGYEYLQNIAGYADWTYEYVYGSFDELLHKLETGEIDLMGKLSYTDERAQLFSYGEYEQGKESFYLFVSENDTSIKSNDYTTLNGKRVGVTTASYQESTWKQWCAENSVVCEVVEYGTSDERRNALNSGEIDAVIESSNGSNAAQDNWRAVFKYGDAPFFFGVSKTRDDLLQDLNDAQERILGENPFYNEDLSLRYSQASSITTKQLTDQEISWLARHNGQIRVGVLDDYLPLADMTEDGEVKGVVADLLADIESAYQDYNVHFEISIYHDSRQVMEDLKNGIIDLAPAYGDYWNADRENIALTNSFMSTTMLMLNVGSYSPDNLHRVGYDEQSPLQTVYAAIHSDDYEWVEYPSMTSAASALKRGEIDGALCTACSYHVFAKTNDDMKEMNRVTLPGKVNIVMAVSKQNPELRSFTNRGISVVGEERIFNSLALNSNVDKKATVSDLVMQNPLMTFLLLCAIVLVVIAVALSLRQAIKKSHTDSMTGLLNKGEMNTRISNQLDKGGVLLIIDIDNFKTVNDQLGHKTGDLVIQHLAESLKETFRTTDVIGRFGGDEFVAFLPNVKGDDSIIAKKAEHLRARFEDCDILAQCEDVDCSVSIGAVRIAPGKNANLAEAFEKADAALYEAKKNGKATFVISCAN